MKLEDKIALITGAAGGIGKGIAKVFADAKGNILISDRCPVVRNVVRRRWREAGR